MTEEEGSINLFMVKIKMANAQEMRMAIGDVERFEGEMGELNHFLKAGDRISAAITAKEGDGWLDPSDVGSLRAALVGRIKRHILNQIQCDESTSWDTVKARLKKAFGGGRWSPEEDILQMFREVRGSRQSMGCFAGKLLAWYEKIADKMAELVSLAEVNARMQFLSCILKIQLGRETGKKFPPEKGFLEVAQELMEECEREREAGRPEIEEPWVPVNPRRQRPRGGVVQPRREEREGGFRKKIERPTERRERTYGRRERDANDRRCFECGSRGHIAAKCPDRRCFECGNRGHIARHCPYLKKTRVDRGEPMETNAQRIRRKSSDSESSRTEASSEEEGSVRRGRESPRATYSKVVAQEKPRSSTQE